MTMIDSATMMFEAQRRILTEKGLARVESFDRFASQFSSPNCLLVPAQPREVATLDWDYLMGLIEWRGRTGRNELDARAFRDAIGFLDVPAMLEDIDDGNTRPSSHPDVAREAIARAGRRSYTLWQGFIHALVHTEVLDRYGLDIVGSRCGEEGVGFCLNAERPVLDNFWAEGAYAMWCAPSYRRVNY
jgi:hypothetical protein